MEELRYQIDLLSAMNQRLSSDEKMYRLICDTSSNAFLYYNFAENKIKTIANWSFFFDFEVKDIKDLAKLYNEVEDKYVLPLRDVLFIEGRGVPSDSTIVRLRDRKTWIEVETSVCYDGVQMPTDKVIRFKNVTKFKSQNDELTYMAYYDIQTGLLNRNYFVNLLGGYVRRAKEEKSTVAVMFIDMDDFHKINDGLGLIVGDEMVQQMGQFLSTLQSDNVIISHFNSDIYCIGIYDPCGARSVEHLYRTIQERMRSPFNLSTGHELTISVSIGVAEYPEAAATTLELINCAEIVMFKAKSSGKNTIRYFDAPILHDFLQNVSIENKLKEAAYNSSFRMHFQPQYRTKDRMLRGVEALIRWRDEDGSMISPALFIPVAEKNGAIVPIGNWVIEESVRIYAGWMESYHYPLILSLNISAIQYKRSDFISQLLEVLGRYGVEPADVELEITESVLIDDFEEITQKLHILRDYGVKISLDDFGTGYSSLSYLKGLPIDTLKIDKSFIDTLTTDENDRIITESIISMVKKLGYETIAEGVETREQYEYLREVECDNIQGYYLGRPMPGQDIGELLARLL